MAEAEGDGGAIVIRHRDKAVNLDVSGAMSVDDVHSTLLAIFRLKKTARVLLKKAEEGTTVVVVPGPRLSPGVYDLEIVDDGNGQSRRQALLALIGAPLLLLYYRVVLPRVIGDD